MHHLSSYPRLMMLRILEKLNDLIRRIKVNIQLMKPITKYLLFVLIVSTILLIPLSPNIAQATTNGLNFANQPIDLRDIETKKFV